MGPLWPLPLQGPSPLNYGTHLQKMGPLWPPPCGGHPLSSFLHRQPATGVPAAPWLIRLLLLPAAHFVTCSLPPPPSPPPPSPTPPPSHPKHGFCSSPNHPQHHQHFSRRERAGSILTHPPRFPSHTPAPHVRGPNSRRKGKGEGKGEVWALLITQQTEYCSRTACRASVSLLVDSNASCFQLHPLNPWTSPRPG